MGMTQYEYAQQLQPYTTTTTDELASMGRGELSMWVERAKTERFEAWKEAYGQAYEMIQARYDITQLVDKMNVNLKRYASGVWQGPCPKCGGTDRFYVYESRAGYTGFRCGHASGGNGCGEKGGVVELYRFLYGGNGWEAMDALLSDMGESPIREQSNQPVRQMRQAPKAPKPKQEKVTLAPSDLWPLVDKSLIAIKADKPYSQAARDYMAGRGITMATMEANSVGLMFLGKRKAISFPHFVDGDLVGINRRIYSPRPGVGEAKTMMKSGARWGVFLLAKHASATTLMVIEGETNGLSIWQVAETMPHLDVISVGSDTNFVNLRDEIHAIGKEYERIVFWADEAEIAQKAAKAAKKALGVDVAAYSSAHFDGVKLDANELLKREMLDAYLNSVCPPPLEVATPKLPPGGTSEPLMNEPLMNEWGELISQSREDTITSVSECFGRLYETARHDEKKRVMRAYLKFEDAVIAGQPSERLNEIYQFAWMATQSHGSLDGNFFHEWVLAMRAVRAGHHEYLSQARDLALAIPDRELRSQCLAETTIQTTVQASNRIGAATQSALVMH